MKHYLTVAVLACVVTSTLYATDTPDAAWREYERTSSQLHAEDQEALKRELKTLNLKSPLKPAYTKELGIDPAPADTWFSSDDGLRVMRNILSFQTPSGGWSKRTDMNQERRPGMAYGVEKKYIPTFDNDATVAQLRLLARAYEKTPKPEYKAAFHRGLLLITKAQYPNGGWPQNYPLVGGYHNHITYNDNLIANLLGLLKDITDGVYSDDLTDAKTRQLAAMTFTQGIDNVLRTQYVINGTPSIWGAQHDRHSGQPTHARAYEMASLATAESASILILLMSIESPSQPVQDAIHAAARWFQTTAIKNTEWVRGTAELQNKAGAKDLWARFYDLKTQKPTFGDRDGKAYSDLSQVSQERLAGYAWYTTAPDKALKQYAKWAKSFPPKQHNNY